LERNPERFKGLKLHASTVSKATDDYRTLVDESNSRLENSKRKLRRFNLGVLRHAVDFILSPSNCAILSWGRKKVIVGDGKYKIIPRINRKKILRHLYRDYELMVCSEVEHLEDYETVQLKPSSKKQKIQFKANKPLEQGGTLKESLFKKIGKALTSRGGKVITSVDYVTAGTLINDATEYAQNVVDTLFIGEEKKKFTDMLTIARNFLTQQYDDHARHWEQNNKHPQL
jgi:hypothetical protein